MSPNPRQINNNVNISPHISYPTDDLEVDSGGAMFWSNPRAEPSNLTSGTGVDSVMPVARMTTIRIEGGEGCTTRVNPTMPRNGNHTKSSDDLLRLVVATEVGGEGVAEPARRT